MGLEGRRIAIFDSHVGTPFIDYLTQLLHEQKVTTVFARGLFPVPSIQLITAHNAAIIHIPQNESDRIKFLKIFNTLKNSKFPFIIIASTTSEEEEALATRLQNEGFVVVDKVSNMNRWIELLGTQLEKNKT